jgi:DNA-binding transcriptional ArsR family regulator/predicted nucleotidyltransferase
MLENTPAIPAIELAVGRSTIRQKILALLTAEPPIRLHLREIQRRVGTSPGTASRELARLVAAGLVEREAEGVQVYFRAAGTPYAAMMRSLLAMAPAVEGRPRPAPIRRVRSGRADAGSSTVEHERPAGPDDGSAQQKPVDAPEPSPAAPPASKARVETQADATAPVDEATVPPGAASAMGSRAPDPLGLVVAARVAAAIRPLYSGRLRGVYLFGARSGAPAPEDADVELMIVLDEVPAYGEELERTSSITAALSIELGLVVSRVFVAETDWIGRLDGQLPLVRGEAVAV